MSKYGALQAASGDAGAWQLIEETEPGEWAPLARGGKQNMIRLAGELNQKLNLYQQLKYTENLPDPAIRAANLEAIRENAELPALGTPITYADVMGWDQEEYLRHRGKLWQRPEGGRGPTYRDGEHGRYYTTEAAAVMTGPSNRGINPWAPKQPGELDRLQALAAAVDHLTAEWDHAGNVKRTAHVKDNVLADWPALAAAMNAVKLAAKPQP